MAKADISVVRNGGGVFNWATDDRTTSTHAATLKPGEPVEAGLTGNNFLVLLLTGEPVQASSTRFIGIVHAESTETSSAEGYCDVEHVVPMWTVLEARMSTVANCDARSEWDDLQGDTVTFDGIASIGDSAVTTPYTIDEDEGDDPNDHGLVLVDWDPNRPAYLQVVVKPMVSLFGNNL